jgi:hypothetical protein
MYVPPSRSTDDIPRMTDANLAIERNRKRPGGVSNDGLDSASIRSRGSLHSG